MSNKTLHAILAIAGSDPSGGAGIQADIKTISALGGYAAAAITCLTIQNTKGVISSHPVDPDIVYQQIKAVLDDLIVTHIKIGMIGSTEIAKSITQALTHFKGEIVFDPVMASSSGLSLFNTDDLPAIHLNLLDITTVLTPNRLEIEMITGTTCDSPNQAFTASANLFKKFPNMQAIIIKGGHFEEQSPLVTDYLTLADSSAANHTHMATHPRINTSNSHGTGCTFASAFSFFHQQTGNYLESFQKSSQFVNTLLQKSAPFVIGQGTGGLLHHLFS